MSAQKDLLTGAENAPQTTETSPAVQTPAQTANVAPWRAAVARAEKGFTAIGGELNFMEQASYAIDILGKSDYLQRLDPKSIQDSVIAVAKLGLTLSPTMKLCYLIPRAGKCTLDISYMGMIHLLISSGAAKMVRAKEIREFDEWEYIPSFYPPLKHKQVKFDDASRGAIIAAYCVITLPDGTEYFEVMGMDEINRVKARSESVRKGTQSPWVTDEPEMIKKTVIRRAFKYVPKVFHSAAWESRVSEAVAIADSDFTDVSEKPKRPPLDVVEVIAE